MIFISCTKHEERPEVILVNDESYLKMVKITPLYSDSLNFIHWNIGHFSKGLNTGSSLIDGDIDSYIIKFDKLINSKHIDVISINEYSSILGVDKGHEINSRDVLFGGYTYAYIGQQNNYSCNALFSNVKLNEVKYKHFSCNSNAVLSMPSYINADDYYYLSSYFIWRDNLIHLINAHLAFDEDNNDININQITELLKLYDSEEYVIMCGDWNATNETYQLFSQKGYELLNCGKFGEFVTHPQTMKPLDNIAVKGLRISNIGILETDLSDHYPISCTISINE